MRIHSYPQNVICSPQQWHRCFQDPIGDKINIRGIQSGNQAGFEQSVATFVDGIYRGRGIQSRFSFLDVAMVEVLRGPQPTLFGKNTIAGALNITTAKPTQELAAEASATYNPEFDEMELQGFVSGPITDNLQCGHPPGKEYKTWMGNNGFGPSERVLPLLSTHFEATTERHGRYLA